MERAGNGGPDTAERTYEGMWMDGGAAHTTRSPADLPLLLSDLSAVARIHTALVRGLRTAVSLQQQGYSHGS